MELEELFTHHYLGDDKPEDYIKWAEAQLLADSDSINIALLASMDFEKPVYRQDVLAQFEKCLQEKSLSWPDEKQTLRKYSQTMARKIIAGHVQPKDAIKQLAKLHLAEFSRQELFIIWFSIAYELVDIEAGREKISYFGFDLETVDAYIIEVAEQYLKLSKLTLPENFFSLNYCEGCRQFHPAIFKSLKPGFFQRVFFKKRERLHGECANCASDKLISMVKFEAREKYLQLL